MPSTRLSSLLALLLAGALLSGCGEDPQKMLASARQYLAKGDTNAATIQLKNALQKDPNLAEARYLFGKVLLESGDPQGAEKELRKAFDAGQPHDSVVLPLAQAMIALDKAQMVLTEFGALKPQQPAAIAAVSVALADAHIALNQVDRAEAAVRAALAAMPKYGPASVTFARVKVIQHDMPGALAVLDGAIKRNPSEYDAITLRGEVHLAEGKPDLAIADYQSAIALRPQLVQARMRLAQVYLGQKALDKAEGVIADAKKASPGNLVVRQLEGVVALYRGQNEKARDSAQMVLRSAPDFMPAVMLLGVAQMRLRDFVQAQASFEKLVAKTPDSQGPRRLLARAQMASNDPSRALETLTPALSRNPDRETLLLAGQAALHSGDAARSAELFAKLSSMNPQDASSRLKLGVARMAAGDREAGMHDLEAAAAMDDKNNEAEIALVMAHIRGGNVVKAREVVGHMIQADPKNPLAYNLLGGVLLAGGDEVGARKAFEKSLEVQPLYLSSAMNLARMDIKAGHVDVAKKRFEALIERNPKAVEAYLQLAKLLSETGANPPEVRKVLERAIAANPDLAAPKLAMLEFHLKGQDSKAALNVAQELIVAFPSDASVLSAAARGQARAGDTPQAIVTTQKLVKLQPNSAGALVMLSDFQRYNKEAAAAEESLRKALQLKPDLIDAQHRLVSIKLEQRKPNEALEIAKDVQKQRPKEALGWIYEGDARAQNKEWAVASKAYAKANELSPSAQVAAKYHNALLETGQRSEADSFAAAWIAKYPKDMAFRAYLGEKAIAAKDFEAAAKAYRAVLELDPKNAVNLNNMAWVAGQLKDPKAMSYADQALALAPDNPAILDTKAQLLFDEGKYGPSAAAFKKALVGAPNTPALHLGLARALAKTGDKAGAKAEVDAVLKLAPENSPIRTDAEAFLKSL